MQGVSLVVINKDDRGVVATLEDLRAARAEVPFATEVVVVDASEGRLDDVRDRFPDAAWVPFAPKPGGKSTIPEQRNAGVARARHDVVVFVDASCRLDPGWLAALVRPIAEDGETMVAGAHQATRSGSLRDHTAAALAGRRYVDEAPTINLAFRREVFDAVGGFDEAFDYGSDVDFTWRAVDAGHRIRWEPLAVVRHDWGDGRDEVRRSFKYGKGRFRLYAKHPGRRAGVLRHEPEMAAYPVLLLLAPLLLVLRPRLLAVLAVPLVKNARRRPVATLASHLVFASGVLTAAWERAAGER